MTKFVQDGDYYVFSTAEKLPSGMTVEVVFQGDYSSDQRFATFNVVLDVFKKRKQKDDNYLHQTGKDGLKPLIFAKKAIEEFAPYILEQYGECHEKMVIQVLWADNRRRRVYERGLKSIGFEFNNYFGYKALYKLIK